MEKKLVENRVSHISKLVSPSPIYPNDRAQVQKVHKNSFGEKKKKSLCAVSIGIRGAFFRRFFVISLPAASWVIHHYSPIHVPTLILRVLFSFSRNFRLCVRTCCHIIATSPQTICHHHREAASHFLSTQHMTSYLRSIAPQTSIATIEFICPSWLKRHPPLSLCLRHSLL